MAIQVGSSFFVPADIDEAWAVLNDVKRVAACVPGAELIEATGEDGYKGRIAVRLGPVLFHFGGTVEFRERDASRHHAVIRATGDELKGRDNAQALVVCDLHADKRGTRVDVKTAL